MTGRERVTARTPAEPWRQRLIRSLLYGRNVDRAEKARARVGLAILAFALVYAVLAGRLVMFAIGATVVLVGAALYEPAADPPPDNILRPGSCVAIEANGDAREVNCSAEDDDLVVVTLVAVDEPCPEGLPAYRDRQGLGMACVRPPG